MVVTLGIHGVDETQVIHTVGEIGQEAADPGSTLTLLPKIVNALHDAPGLAEEPKILAFAFQGFPVEPFELRFVVEGVEVADTAAAEDLDDAFGFGGEVSKSGAGATCAGEVRAGGGTLSVEYPSESDSTEAAAGVPKKMTPGQERWLG